MEIYRPVKIILIPVLLLLIGVAHGEGLPHGYPKTSRQKININSNWKFHLNDPQGVPWLVDYDDSDWKTVHVPHTLKLTSLNLDDCQDDKTQATFHRDVGWYRKHLQIDTDPDKMIFLEFEGAHQVTDVWVNGKYVGQHAIGGYTPFHFDITDFVHSGNDNVVTLKVDNRKNPDVPPDPGPFDYIKFSGLYRDVYLVQTDRLYIPFPWEKREAGVRITTPTVKPGFATIDVKTTVRNLYDTPRLCSILTRVINADGIVVLKMNSTAEIPPDADYTFSQVNGLDEDVHLWSCSDPYLYRVNTLVLDGDKPVDCIENPLGLRKFELREGEGFFLNGEPLMLIGTNRHQHYAYIGDAMTNSLHWKDALQFKACGFNVVRLAHYPHDNAFIEACDKLGILVYEEAPSWIDFGTETWEDNLEKALRRTIRNHRNHPSILIWGGGINHRGSHPRLHYAAKEEDPTRWTASNNSMWCGDQRSGYCDIYSNMDYRHITSKHEFMFAMEHSGSWDGEVNQRIVSRYKGNPKHFAMALWTAHAYYTFHPPGRGWVYRTRGGLMDIFRIPRTAYYWYISELTDEPMVHIADNWKKGIEKLRIFSNCDEVELIINGRSLGKRGPDTDSLKINLDHPCVTFPVTWEEGTVTARGFIDGIEKASQTIRTPTKPVGIRLIVDLEQRDFVADGSDIVVAYAHVIDKYGTTVPDFAGKVTFSVKGPAEIVGDEYIHANPMECFHGIAPVLVRADVNPGKIVLKAEAEGLKQAEALFNSVPNKEDVIAAKAKPIYDLYHLKLDLGGKGQHVQYGWQPMYGNPEIETVWEFDGLAISVRPASNGKIQWFGANNITGWLGFMAEDGVVVLDEKGFEIEFFGLKPGRYLLKMVHHSPQKATDSMDPLKDDQKIIEITKIKPADSVNILLKVGGAKEKLIVSDVNQTIGRDVGSDGPVFNVIEFGTDEEKSVTIRIKPQTEGAVWLNGLDLQKRL